MRWELFFYRVMLYEFDYAVPKGDTVAARQGTFVSYGIPVYDSRLSGTQVFQGVPAVGAVGDLGVLRFDFYVPNHDVRPERVVAEH